LFAAAFGTVWGLIGGLTSAIVTFLVVSSFATPIIGFLAAIPAFFIGGTFFGSLGALLGWNIPGIATAVGTAGTAISGFFSSLSGASAATWAGSVAAVGIGVAVIPTAVINYQQQQTLNAAFLSSDKQFNKSIPILPSEECPPQACFDFAGKNTTPFSINVYVHDNPVHFSSDAKQHFKIAANHYGISPKIIAAISVVEAGSLYSNSFNENTEAYCAPSGDGCGSWGPFQFLHNKPPCDNGDPEHPSCFGVSCYENPCQLKSCPNPSAVNFDSWDEVKTAYMEVTGKKGENICSLVHNIYAITKRLATFIPVQNWSTDQAYINAIMSWNPGACSQTYPRLGDLSYCDFAVWFNQNYNNNLDFIGSSSPSDPDQLNNSPQYTVL
ncbi:MAG: hypothetical protein ABII08_05220, partial [Candidatus Beckwithbacteria bacterium]